jgi:hypothetical protein
VERLRSAVQRRTECVGLRPRASTARLFPRFLPFLSLASCTWLTAASPARAQTGASVPPVAAAPARTGADGGNPAEIVAARELFRKGAEDADAGRFAEGLEKFKRVAAVKETAAVRFNIASCEEALGKTGAALADFELAAREGGQDAKADDVAKLAVQRADALRPRVPRLTVVPPAHAPDGMTVSLDGGKLTNATLAVGLPLDPGRHVVDAVAPGRASFHAELSLDAGEAKRVDLSLPLQGDFAAGSPAGGAPDANAGELPRRAHGSSQVTWGWVTLVAGGALAVGSGVFLLLHDNAVSTLNDGCPVPAQCQASPEQQASLNTTASNARLYEGLSIGLLAGGALAVGTGVVLLATAPNANAKTPAVAVTAGAPNALAGLSLHASF